MAMHEYDIQVGDTHYRGQRLDPFKQFHLTRKIGPLAPKIVPVLLSLQRTVKEKEQGGSSDFGIDEVAALLGESAPFLEAFAALPEADVDHIIKTCLASVKVYRNDVWAPLVVNGSFMFNDMELGDMLPIVARVLGENLGNFIRGLVGSATSSKAPT